MFYRPDDGHGLPHNPLAAIVAPRPIAWISTRGADGSENLAPYSFFNLVAYAPPQVMFASIAGKADRARGKDTLANIEETGVFCVNVAEYAARAAVNDSSGPWPRETDEMTRAGLARQECAEIACARLRDAPAALECRLTEVKQIEGEANFVVFARVVGVHLRDDCLCDGVFDVTRFKPLTRLGYMDYGHISEVFAMERPE